MLIIPPQRIQHSPVGEDADQPVLHGDVMEKGLLGVHDEGVRDPKELHEPPVEAQALVSLEHQTLVRPALAEEYGGCVVLQNWGPKVIAGLMDYYNKHVYCTIC